MSHLPHEVLRHPDNNFMTPSELIDAYEPMDVVDVPHIISWADTERDLSAWLGNTMQSNALHELFKLEQPARLSDSSTACAFAARSPGRALGLAPHTVCWQTVAAFIKRSDCCRETIRQPNLY